MIRLIDTLTLQEAVNAVEKYNRGYYGRKLNICLDNEGYQLFNNSLGRDLDTIEKQVHFIGKDYGGVAGFKSAINLYRTIARQIFNDRDYFIKNAGKAAQLKETPVKIEVLKRLYKPFIQPFKDRKNWHVWATKFLHFTNPNAFPIQDSRVNTCFKLSSQAISPEKYNELIVEVRQFLHQHQSWLPVLREADKDYSWSDLKLLDKVFYSIGEDKECTP